MIHCNYGKMKIRMKRITKMKHDAYEKTRMLITKILDCFCMCSSKYTFMTWEIWSPPSGRNIINDGEKGCPWNRTDNDGNFSLKWEDIIYGKGHSSIIPKFKSRRWSDFLDLIHTDVSGHFHSPSLEGSRYFLTYIDVFSYVKFQRLM